MECHLNILLFPLTICFCFFIYATPLYCLPFIVKERHPSLTSHDPPIACVQQHCHETMTLRVYTVVCTEDQYDAMLSNSPRWGNIRLCSCYEDLNLMNTAYLAWMSFLRVFDVDESGGSRRRCILTWIGCPRQCQEVVLAFYITIRIG